MYRWWEFGDSYVPLVQELRVLVMSEVLILASFSRSSFLVDFFLLVKFENN